MLAYKVNGRIDDSGKLIVTEPIQMNPGEVEVIVLQTVAAPESETAPTSEANINTFDNQQRSRVKSLKELLGNAPPLPPDFDAELAKWEYLKEKHNL